ALAGADDVEPLVVVGETEAVGVGHLVLADDQVHAPARIHSIDTRRHLAAGGPDLRRLAEPRLEPPRPVARPPWRVGRALVELAAVGRIREPVAAARMWGPSV